MQCLEGNLSYNFCGPLNVLYSGLGSLFAFFRKALFSPQPAVFSSLANRAIRVGGVENGGSTCVLAVLLQEWAALPLYYDAFLNTPLKKGEKESDSNFLQRKELQSYLRDCIHKLRSGSSISRAEIGKLSSLLLQLGWQKKSVTSWGLFLHSWAPNVFSLPLSNPYELYETVIALFPEAAYSPHKIALLARASSVSQRELFENSPLLANEHENILWRVSEDLEAKIFPEENLEIDHRQFTLKLVHVYQPTSRGNHVLVYRKEGDEWMCCNDARVQAVEVLPSTHIYAVVYESRLLPSDP